MSRLGSYHIRNRQHMTYSGTGPIGVGRWTICHRDLNNTNKRVAQRVYQQLRV